MKEREPKLTEAQSRLYAGRSDIVSMSEGMGGEFEKLQPTFREGGFSREFEPSKPAKEPPKIHETVRSLFASPALAGSSEARRGLASSLFELTNSKPLKEWEGKEYGEALSVLPGEAPVALDLRQKLLGLAQEHDKSPQELGEAEMKEERRVKKGEGLEGFTKKIRSNLADLDKEALLEKRNVWRGYEDKAEDSGDKEAAKAASSVVKMIQEAQELQVIAQALNKTNNVELQDYARDFLDKFKKGDELSKEELLKEYEKLMLLKTRLQIDEKGNDENIAGYTRPLFSVMSSRLEEKGVSNEEMMEERGNRLREAGHSGHPQNQSLGADRREEDTMEDSSSRGKSPLERINPEDFPLGEEGEPEELQEWKNKRRNFVIQAQQYAKSGNPQALQALWGSQMDSFMSKGSAEDQALMGAVMEELHSYSEEQAKLGVEHKPYEDKDKDLYEGDIHETLDARMKRILDEAGRYDEESVVYYNDIRTWVNRILKNDVRELDGGRLRLQEDRYRLFKEIVSRKEEELTSEKIRADVRRLRDKEQGDLFKYLRQKDGSGISRISSLKKERERGRGSDLPQSLQATMELVVAQYGGEWNGGLAPGGEYELIDLEGNFHVENFNFWVRQQVNDKATENPKQEIKPLSEISLRTGYSQISLAEILYTPQYRKEMPLVVSGDEMQDDAIEAYWGEPVEHEDFDKQKARNTLYEIYFYGRAHSEAGTSSTNKGDQKGYMDASMQMHGDSATSRGLWGIWFQAPSRGEGSAKEFKEGGDGTMGRAIRETVIAYSYLTEFTEFYKEGGSQKKDVPVKKFEDNMFYKFLEPNGANAFLLSLSEGALDQSPDVKKAYNSFVEDRIVAAAEEYCKRPGLSEEDKAAIRDAGKSSCEKVESEGLSIQFDRCDYLRNFHVRMREKVLCEGKVGVKEKKKIDEDVRNDLLRNLKDGFFSKVKEVKISGTTVGVGDVEFEGEKLGNTLDSFAENLLEDYKNFIDYDRDSSPEDIISKRGFEEFFKKNERLAIALAEKVAGKKRIELNQFRNPSYGPSEKTFLDSAIEKAIAKTAFGLADVEADYSLAWARNLLTSYDIADLNDTTGTGFGYGTRLLQTQRHLARQLDRVNPVNKAAIVELGVLMLPMMQMLRVKKPGEAEQSFHDVLQGGKGTRIKSRRERVLESPDQYKMGENDEMNMVINPRRNASEFLEKLKKGGLDLGGVAETDIYGNVIINSEKAADVFTTAWKTVRYAYNQAGTDYSETVVRDGKEIDLFHLYFGPKSREVLDAVQKGIPKYADDPKWKYKNPAMGVYGMLVGAEIAAHRNHNIPKKYWSIQQINEIERVMAHVFAQHELMGEGDAKKLNVIGTLIGPKVFDTMLGVNGESYNKMYNTEFMWAFFTGLLLAFKEGVHELAPLLPPKD